MTYRRDQTVRASLITATLPPHSTSKPLRYDILCLLLRHLRRVVANHQSGIRVIAVARGNIIEIRHRGPGLRKPLVVPHPVFPGTAADPAEARAWPVGVGECAAVQRHAKDNFVRGDAVGDVVVYCLLGVEGRAGRIAVGSVYVCVVTGDRVPAS